MLFHQLGVLSIFLALLVQPLLADSQKDLKSRVKLFCDEKVKLTTDSIEFDVQKIVSVKGSVQGPSIASLATLQIATMHLNCNLFAGGLITADQFLGTQTQILQYGLDQQMIAALTDQQAAGKTSSVTASSQAPSSSQTESTTVDKTSQDTKSNSQVGKVNTSGEKTEKGRKGATQKPADLDINKIAGDLGAQLKKKVGVVESGNEDVVDSGIRRLFQQYSPITISNE